MDIRYERETVATVDGRESRETESIELNDIELGNVYPENYSDTPPPTLLQIFIQLIASKK